MNKRSNYYLLHFDHITGSHTVLSKLIVSEQECPEKTDTVDLDNPSDIFDIY